MSHASPAQAPEQGPLEPLCCQGWETTTRDEREEDVLLALGQLLEGDAFARRMQSHPVLSAEAVSAFAAQRVSGEIDGLCLIGSFTYDPYGWDDVDVVVLTSEVEPVLAVTHDCPFGTNSDDLRIDLITLSRGGLETPERFGLATFPRFVDSRGEPYDTFCLRRRCMAASLSMMLHFGVWLRIPAWVNPQRAATRQGALSVWRLCTEAKAYLADEMDALKGLRRLFLARKLLERLGERVDGGALLPLLQEAQTEPERTWRLIQASKTTRRELADLIVDTEKRVVRLLSKGHPMEEARVEDLPTRSLRAII